MQSLLHQDSEIEDAEEVLEPVKEDKTKRGRQVEKAEAKAKTKGRKLETPPPNVPKAAAKGRAKRKGVEVPSSTMDTFVRKTRKQG